MKLKVKLAYKLFFAFLFTSSVIIMMIGVMQYYAADFFKDYINRVRMDNLEDVAEKLAEKYREFGSWEPFKSNPAIFMEMMKANGIQIAIPPTVENERNTKRIQTIFRFGEHMSVQLRTPVNIEGKPDKPGDMPMMAHMGPGDYMELHKRIGLVLLNIKKSPVMGPPVQSEGMMLKAIEADGKTVGFLGIPRINSLTTPLETAFLERQFKLFYFVGGLILVLIVVISFFLSRLIVIPLKKLAKGAKMVEERKFDISIDINTGDELENLARDFNHMVETLKNYEEMREQWMIDISHELRTPLTVLQGEIEAMQDGIRIPDEKSLGSLHSEIVRLSRLVEDLRLLSLSDASALTLKKTRINPVLILNESITIYLNRMNMQHLEIRFLFDMDMKVTMNGDKDRLTQLYSNILENTLKYADHPGTLYVSAEKKGNKKNSELIIAFEDSGPGVPEESLPKLFNRLYRVDKCRSRDLGGTGLGLSIVKRIAESHDGGVKAMNGKKGGLRIEINLPLTDEE